MKLVITIDTEEDGWGKFAPSGHSVSNIERILPLQAMFDQFGAIPTYLVTYPVATDRACIDILRAILEDARCEIGMHCHPWNTPPVREECNAVNSMLCNLPVDLMQSKLSSLHKTIAENFSIEPKTFRAGRWGYNQQVAAALYELGYQVDTSVTSFVDWGAYHGPDFSRIGPQPYRCRITGSCVKQRHRGLIEVPATVGYLHDDFVLCNRVWHFLNHKHLKPFRVLSILEKLKLLRRVWLSPEVSDSQSMISLVKTMIRNGYEIANLFFHSTSLKAGLSPFVQTKSDELVFLNRIRDFLVFTQTAGIESVPLSASAAHLV